MISHEFSIFLLIGYAIQSVSPIFWYHPSRLRTLDNCITLKEQQAEYYPNYCDRLIEEYGVSAIATTSIPAPVMTTGWGWAQWGEWMEDSCPEDCGRRCRMRRRHCMGPYAMGCRNEGESYAFDNCESRNKKKPTTNKGGGGGQKPIGEKPSGGPNPPKDDDEKGDPFQRATNPRPPVNNYRRTPKQLIHSRVVKRRRKYSSGF